MMKIGLQIIGLYPNSERHVLSNYEEAGIMPIMPFTVNCYPDSLVKVLQYFCTKDEDSRKGTS